MGNISINRLMKLINTLSIEHKLEVLTRISKSIKLNIKKNRKSKEDLLDDLFGAWSEIEIDLAKQLVQSRTDSERKISLD